MMFGKINYDEYAKEDIKISHLYPQNEFLCDHKFPSCQYSAEEMENLLANYLIDEIGELCENINNMASELEKAETMKNDFISSVSHELRTPLTAIRGWGETAKMSLGTDEDLVARGLDVVLSEADRLSGLVEDLLDFSRMHLKQREQAVM